ncbi:hypothetical protein [Streptomyces sp. NPDC059874]|uniref:hypothetical protein n=1 Tax=Streptomyces sp. NPDC059874 TaxID=3346983 RepID=UPI00365FD13C
MTSRAQRAAPWPRPLLLAALLLGMVTMHVLGHPTESHASEDASTARSVASAGPPDPAADGEPHHARTPLSGAGTDPGSVCLAVLVVPRPDTGPAGSRDTAPLGGAARTPDRSAGGPDPPSPRELLDRPAVPRV